MRLCSIARTERARPGRAKSIRLLALIDVYTYCTSPGHLRHGLNIQKTSIRRADGQPHATHALQFYWIATSDDFRYPVAYFLTKSATGVELFEFVCEGLLRLAEAGFDVLFLLSDGGSGNRSFFEVHTKHTHTRTRARARSPLQRPPAHWSRIVLTVAGRGWVCCVVIVQNLPHKDGVPSHEKINPATGETLYVISDPVHLHKKLRNQLLASFPEGDKRGTRNMRWQGHDAVWSHVIACFTLQARTSVEASPYPVRRHISALPAVCCALVAQSRTYATNIQTHPTVSHRWPRHVDNALIQGVRVPGRLEQDAS